MKRLTMKTLPLLASCTLLLSSTAAGLAQDYTIYPEDRDLTAPLPEDMIPPPLPPPEGQSVRKYATDDPGNGPANFGRQVIHDDRLKYYFMADRLEYRFSDQGQIALWDFQGYIGGDYNKLWLESEGEWKEGEGFESADLEVLYARSITSFWDLRAGGRYDFAPHPERSFGVLSLQGLAPYFFETEFNLYLDNEGRLSFNYEVEFDIRLSQRLVFQPRLETDIAAQDAREYDIGAGFTKIEVGARLRYEITRKFAPYIGVSWESALGESAQLIRAKGGDPRSLSFVTGVRFWF